MIHVEVIITKPLESGNENQKVGWKFISEAYSGGGRCVVPLRNLLYPTPHQRFKGRVKE